jgi:hypothetical protein
MMTDVMVRKRLAFSHALWAIGLLLCVVTAAGCPRIVSLD